MKTKIILGLLVLLQLFNCSQSLDKSEIVELSKKGETLPVSVTKRFPLPEQKVENDRGINVLFDNSHDTKFVTLWRFPRMLRSRGFRVIGSSATLNTVLERDGKSRIRIDIDYEEKGKKRFPYAWWPNAEYNVVVTRQASPEYQGYLPEEITALKKFVKNGGGLVIFGGRVRDKEQLQNWSINDLMNVFGASLTDEVDSYNQMEMNALNLKESWNVFKEGDNGNPVMARRKYGKGRVFIIGGTSFFQFPRGDDSESEAVKNKRMDLVTEILTWSSEGKEPVGGGLRLPSIGAGGPIYPDKKEKIGNVVLYYTGNQTDKILEAIKSDMPKSKKKIEDWLPSPKPDEPMNILLMSGTGGGFAVNAYLPKEIASISIRKKGLLSVFAHELAHTMSGPSNAKGEKAGHCYSFPDQGEAHAGWFQAKSNAYLYGDMKGKNPNRIFEFSPDLQKLDLAREIGENNEKWGKGKHWLKTWYVWQKLDERYGPTWYPRWRWVQHTRWMDEPDRKLSMDEIVTDMSIAVGEDLFPFFQKIGTTLDKDRLKSANFQEEEIKLPVADIGLTKCGDVILDDIGDYKKPL
ncbi:MAG TPA: hypothetical protein VKP78_10650 [bacterium]|nr:hypothetical protein [bacterium]